MSRRKKPTFEECYSVIEAEINKRRLKWQLHAIRWMDFDDVKQILLIHIQKKWHLYNSQHNLLPWLSVVINHQLSNLMRNHYGNYSLVCLKCAAFDGHSKCKIYKEVSIKCPLYYQWSRFKESALHIKLPLSTTEHENEIENKVSENIDIESSIRNVHEKMYEILTPVQYKIYCCLYIKHLSEEDTARKMGYKSTERGRTSGYATIAKIKKVILEKAKEMIYGGEVDMPLN